MNKGILVLTVWTCALSGAASAQSKVTAAAGDITVTPIEHASVQVEYGATVIQVDPAQGDLAKARQADLVLVTDIHFDHLNPDGIAKVRKNGAPVVMPAAAQRQAGTTIPAPIVVMANGETRTVGGTAIEAVPMYNLQRGPAAGQLFHTKGRGNGYIVTLGGITRPGAAPSAIRIPSSVWRRATVYAVSP